MAMVVFANMHQYEKVHFTEKTSLKNNIYLYSSF